SSKRTVCGPPGAITVTGEVARPLVIAATADAHDPVPEDCVSPAPRSNIRISISWAPRSFLPLTRTYTTFVPCGNWGCVWSRAAWRCHPSGKLSYENYVVRIAHRNFRAYRPHMRCLNRQLAADVRLPHLRFEPECGALPPR